MHASVLFVKNTCILVCLVLFFFGVTHSVQGEDELSLSFGVGDFHITGDRTLYYSKTKAHEAFGHVVMSSNDRRLSADYVWIDTKTGDTKASGNVVFASSQRTIYAAEIHFNIHSGLGSIFYGLITNGRYHLRGQLIREVSKNRFVATEGEYTTCLDCSESWRVYAQSIDLSSDGYVFMTGVYLFIKDIPALYLPYLVLPAKTERQSGLLFPRISNSSLHGFTLYQPLFLAINGQQDATLSYGFYSKRGNRAGLEYRYKLLKNNEGTIDGVFIKDRTFPDRSLRFSLQMDHTWYPFDFFKMYLRLNEVSDRDYPRVFLDDIKGNDLPALESSAVLMSDFDDFFIDVEWTRLRSLIAKDKVNFDEDMVQRGPSLFGGVKEWVLWRGITGGVFFRYDRFHRGGSSFTGDRLRESQRILLNPSLSYSFKIGDVLNVSPLLEYDQQFYSFGSGTKDLLNHHLLSQVRISTALEKIYNLNGPLYSKLKHQISPFISYSNVFWRKDSPDHPFTQQIEHGGGVFDEMDRTPITYSRDNVREPLGNAISYGFTSRLIRKRREEKHISFYPYDLTKTIEKKYPKPQNMAQEIQIVKQRHWDKNAPDYSLYKEVWLLAVNQSYDFRRLRIGMSVAPLPRLDPLRLYWCVHS